MGGSHPSCSPAPQLPSCCADPTKTHAGITSRTEIPVPSLVPGSWITVCGSRNAHFGVCSWCVAAGMQRLAKSSSGWNFSLGHLDLNFKHKPLSHLFLFACIVPLPQQPPGTRMFFPCGVKSWHFEREHLIPTHWKAEFGAS